MLKARISAITVAAFIGGTWGCSSGSGVLSANGDAAADGTAPEASDASVADGPSAATVSDSAANDGPSGDAVGADALADSGSAVAPEDSGSDAALPAPGTIVKLRLGGYHGCVLFGDGSLWCWGNNMAGQLAMTPDTLAHPTPVQIAGVSDVVDFALGRYDTCALTRSGSLLCWGINTQYQLGHDNTHDVTCSIFGGAGMCSPTPTAVANVTGVASIALGYTQSCVRATSGAVACWGGNAYGELGHDAGDSLCSVYGTPTACNSVPSAVAGLPLVTSIAAGYGHTVATPSARDAGIFTWGANDYAQLGLGPADNGAHPTAMSTGLVGSTGLASLGGSSFFSCAVLPGGGASCWGANADWESSPGVDAGAAVTAPTSTDVSGIVELALGGDHACALTQANAVECWGYNGSGQLAHNPASDPTSGIGDPYSATPGVVSGVSGVTQVAAGGYTSCVLQADNTVWCWGRNSNGEAGHGSSANDYTPTQVLGLGNGSGGADGGTDAGDAGIADAATGG